MGSCLPPSTSNLTVAEPRNRLGLGSQSQRIKPSNSLKPKPQIQKLGQGLGREEEKMEERRNKEGVVRVPLSEVVSDCVKRWFQDTLKEAKNGDQAMQVLVGQMYQSGYGVPKNEQKARAWMTKASKYRSSVWKVCDKQPGYNASDSDSEEVEDDKS